MKLYTFLNETGGIIIEVRAENHDQAISAAGVSYDTDFYSDSLNGRSDAPCWNCGQYRETCICDTL